MFKKIKHMSIVRKLFRKAFNANAKFIRFVSMRAHGDGADPFVEEKDKDCQMMMITIAFNHVGLIEKQIDLVKQYVSDADYRLVIADNSPDSKKRAAIKALCESRGVLYVPVPRIIERCCWHRMFYGGISHGGALNWVFFHYLAQATPKRFALLDHDVFPLAPFNMTEVLGDKPFYGVSRFKKHGWYLWPGWCIFDYSFMKARKPDFLPVYVEDSYLDSGGHNFFHVYRPYDPATLDFPTVQMRRVKHTKGLHRHDEVYHMDYIQMIAGAWIHLINGSNCAHIPGKEKVVEKLLQNLHRFQPSDSVSF